MKSIVVLGGGFAGVSAAKSLLKSLPAEWSVTLISSSLEFTFKPLLHELATGAFGVDVASEDISSSIKHPRFSFIEANATSIDLKKQAISVANQQIGYDCLIIAIGSEPNFFGIPGAEKYALPLNSVADALKIKKVLVAASKKSKPRIIITGGGALGTELSTEIAEFMDQLNRERMIVVINRDPEILPMVSDGFRDRAELAMHKRRVHLLQNTAVAKVAGNYIITDKKEKISADVVIWTAGIKPSPIKVAPKIEMPKGYFPVEQTLQLKGFKNVFAVGDCAFVMNPDGFPVPQLAQSAIDEGKFAAKNVVAAINNQPLKSYRFRSKGFILPLGKGYAVAEIKGVTVSGFIAWWANRTAYMLSMLTSRHKIFVVLNWTVGLFKKRSSD